MSRKLLEEIKELTTNANMPMMVRMEQIKIRVDQLLKPGSGDGKKSGDSVQGKNTSKAAKPKKDVVL